MLIGVTRSLRDWDAFASLSSALPRLVRQAAEKDEKFRVWVAGCATGGEADSAAIFVRESLDSLGREIPVKIFATGVRLSSLEFVSATLYRGPARQT